MAKPATRSSGRSGGRSVFTGVLIGLTFGAVLAVGFFIPMQWLDSQLLAVTGSSSPTLLKGTLLLILLGLLVLRLLLHNYIGHLLPPRQTAALFFVLAFGMILRWRVGMFLRFRRLTSGTEA